MATATIEIFRAGTHTDASGATFTFSERDIARIADAYDARKHEAPLVVGHPRDNAPAYGWTRALAASGGKLSAVVGDVDADFAEGALRTKRYKKVSASFYKPGAPGNPMPGGYYLRHIGLLGAQPPAVKGLRDASFSDRASDTVTISFEEAGEVAQQAAEAAVDTTADAGAAEVVFSASQIELLKKLIAEAIGAAAKATDAAPAAADTADHAEAGDVIALLDQVPDLTPEQLAALKEHIALAFQAAPSETPAATADHAEGREVKRLRAELAAQKAASRAKDRGARIEGLVAAGILTPGQRKAALSFAELVDGDAVDFAEGDRRPRSQILVEDLLAKFPPQILTGEVAGVRDFAEGDQSSEAIAKAAVSYQSEQLKHGRVVHIADAVAHVTKRTR